MYTSPPKKLLIINILDILKKYSDENHRLSQSEIIKILKNEYEMTVDRKAVKRNLMNLIDFGYEIEYSQTIRKNKNGIEETLYSDWYLNRDFTDAELRLLIDGLLFSKHIPYNQCKELIKKIEGLSNIYFHTKVRHICNMPEHLPHNKELFYTIEILDEAIHSKRMVEFQYTEFGTDKKPALRKSKSGAAIKYKVSPYQMAATNGRYYLICNRKHYSGVSNYRIDRIKNICLTNEPSVPTKDISALKNGLNLPQHMAEHIYMFAGEGVRVKFRAKQYLVSDILDWFCGDVNIIEEENDTITVSVKVNEQAMFYWSMQYGEHTEIIEPKSLREKIKATLKEMAEKYSD